MSNQIFQIIKNFIHTILSKKNSFKNIFQTFLCLWPEHSKNFIYLTWLKWHLYSICKTGSTNNYFRNVWSVRCMWVCVCVLYVIPKQYNKFTNAGRCCCCYYYHCWDLRILIKWEMCRTHNKQTNTQNIWKEKKRLSFVCTIALIKNTRVLDITESLIYLLK